MPTYVYSPISSVQSQQSNGYANYHKNRSSSVPRSPPQMQMMPQMPQMQMMPQPNNNITLEYETKGPKIVTEGVTRRANGGVNLRYRVKKPYIVPKQPMRHSPKLRFIHVAKLINPKRLD